MKQTNTPQSPLLRKLYSRLRLSAISLVIGMFVITPIMHLVIRTGLIQRTVSKASKLLPYEAPALQAFGDLISDDANAAPPPLSH